jgi:hypothetical protein
MLRRASSQADKYCNQEEPRTIELEPVAKKSPSGSEQRANRRIRTFYIASPPGGDLTHLRASLVTRGIRVIVPDDVAPDANLNVPTAISHTLTEADLVIGVLTRERRSQWVLFELGQASAMGRQIVLLAPPMGDPVPSNVFGFLVLRINLQNRGAIDFALDQLLAAPSPTFVRPTTRRTGQGLGTITSRL